MGRTSSPLYKDPNSGNYFGRWYEGTKRNMLSLNTSDPIEAMKRLPIVQSTKMSWNQYQKTFSGFSASPITTVNGAGPHTFSPPIVWQSTKSGTMNLIEQALKLGIAKYNQSTGEWIIEDIAGKLKSSGDVIDDLASLKKTLKKTDNLKEIKEFYTTVMPQFYTDKDTANRFGKIWLQFLDERNVTSWSQISEELLSDFKKWRKSTKMSRNGRDGVLPSALVVNRHMKYLDKSFVEAHHREYIKMNPIRNWKPDPHTAPLQNGLTIDELHSVLSHEKLQKDYLMNGLQKVHLGYKLLDYYALIFTSCKRRGEVVHLLIEDIDYTNHYAHYVETKNSSKGTRYSIHKAFWLTPEMENMLRRVCGNRTSGPVFPCPSEMKKSDEFDDGFLNGDYLSQLFKDIVTEKVPHKDVTLNNLRHTATDILEKAKLTDEEIDAALGHHQVKTALPFYKDRSADAIARRLSERTRKGVEILSNTIKKFL